MLFEIVVVVCVAFAAAGIVMAVLRLFSVKLPIKVVIGIAGVAMIVLTAWNRYGWAERTKAGLPKEIRIVQEIPYSDWLEPWTYAYPRVGALVVIDDSQTLTNPARPDWRIVTLLNIQPYAETLVLRQIVDCAGHRRAIVDADASFDAGGMPANVDWVDGGQPPSLFKAACGPAVP